MNIKQKIIHLRTACYEDLNDWGKEFISDMNDLIEDCPDEPTNEELSEFLTRRQIDKINELWEDEGL